MAASAGQAKLHSWADAPVPLQMFFHDALPYAESLPVTPPAPEAEIDVARWPPHEALDWDLSDAALLSNLEMRFHKRDVYTYTCQILIAINPFDDSLAMREKYYTDEVMERYSGRPMCARRRARPVPAAARPK